MCVRARTSTTSQQLVALHAVTLLERGHLSLVPQYLCHLRDGLREALSLELLTSCSKPFTGGVLPPCSLCACAKLQHGAQT